MDLANSILKNMTSESSISALTSKLGGSSEQVTKGIESAIPGLLKSMNKNVASEEGAKSLVGALDQHKNTDSIDKQIKDADEDDGNKIIGHILGGGKNDFIGAIAKETGLDISQSGALLANIAPALLSTLSSAKNSALDKGDDIDIKDLLGSFIGDKDEKKGLSGGSLLKKLKDAIF